MAISDPTNRIQYTGNGSSSVPYPVPFLFFADDDLKVWLTDTAGETTQLTLGADYTATGEGNDEGGSVTTVLAYDGTHKVTIVREIEADQPATFMEGGKFPAKTVERCFDRLTMAVQQALSGRAHGFRLADHLPEWEPLESVLPNVFLGLDGEGNPRFYTIADLLALISLPAPVLNFPVKTFADAGQRAAAVPDFAGQPGTQRDTKAIYISTGTTAGAWGLFKIGSAQVTAEMIHGLANDGTIAGTGEFAYTPSPFSAQKRGTFQQLKTWLNSDSVRPGAVINSAFVEFGERRSITATIPNDDTIPQISEGGQLMTAVITPVSATNLLRARFTGKLHSTSGGVTAALFVQGIVGAIDVAVGDLGESEYRTGVSLSSEVVAGTTDPVTFEVRVGRAGTSAAINANGINAGRRYGGAMKTSLLIEEIKV